MTTSNNNLSLSQNSDGKGDSKVKKGPLRPLKILEEDDEDLSALKDPSEKVSVSPVPAERTQMKSVFEIMADKG